MPCLQAIAAMVDMLVILIILDHADAGLIMFHGPGAKANLLKLWDAGSQVFKCHSSNAVGWHRKVTSRVPCLTLPSHPLLVDLKSGAIGIDCSDHSYLLPLQHLH
jgi:hypothetical protein